MPTFSEFRARARACISTTYRDIGERTWPKVRIRRRTLCERNFRAFCETYFDARFPLPWSDDHLRVLGKIQRAVLEGGLFAVAMPRGSGKTTLCEVACIWAVVYGHRRFVALLGASEPAARGMLESIKTEIEHNDTLAEDFDEVCGPVRELEGIANRCAGQLSEGERTRIRWTTKYIVLPTIAGSKASGAVVRVSGLTGAIRGMKHTLADGSSIRPDLVIPDDCQTDASARSAPQVEMREHLLAGAVLGLAGPGKKISGIMPCTVVRRDDVADRILDPAKHPEWQGERTKLVYAFPANETLWKEYAEHRADGLRAGRGIRDATEFYRRNRQAMDEGAIVAWQARHNADELSAIQHAMNLRLDDEPAFWAEYQNEPLPDVPLDDDTLTPAQIEAKINRLKRGRVPLDASHVTAFIDVQDKLLYWLVAAWADDFTGAVVDYGAWPEQPSRFFTLRAVAKSQSLRGINPSAGLEAAIQHALEQLTARLLGHEWQREDGAALRIDRCLVDANWGQSTDIVYQFCRRSPHASTLLPSHGRYVGAASSPFEEWKRKPGERIGEHWRIPSVAGKRAVRHLLFDANWWKSFVHARLAQPSGDRGALTLYGDNPAEHRLLAEHLTAEFRVRTSGRGREVDEWKIKPAKPDNHWLDCLVGAAVAAAMSGSALSAIGRVVPRQHQRPPTLAELLHARQKA